MKSFNVMALDANFQIISLLRYTNIQWSRKYHESGSFSIQIPLEQYSESIMYIYTKDRPEVGKVTQKNYVSNGKYKYFQLSGYFLEYELNRRVVYQKASVSNILNAPSWEQQDSNAETVAHAFFNAFKDVNCYLVKFDTGQIGASTYYMNSYLGIDSGTNLERGNRSIHTRNGEYLGDKIFNILKPSGMSYRISYNFTNNKKVFSCWKGVDRTEGQTINNQIVFSTKYGNILNINVLLDDTEYKTVTLSHSEMYLDADIGESKKQTYVGAIYDSENLTVGLPPHTQTDITHYVTTKDNFLYFESNYIPAELGGDTEYLSLYEVPQELEDHIKTINMEFDSMENSYEYMVDFDIGDVCSIEIPEINISYDARLIGCYEVTKDGKWEMTLEFGTPLIKKI